MIMTTDDVDNDNDDGHQSTIDGRCKSLSVNNNTVALLSVNEKLFQKRRRKFKKSTIDRKVLSLLKNDSFLFTKRKESLP